MYHLTFYNNIFQYVYEYMNSEKLLSSSYKEEIEEISYVINISISDYVYKEVTLESKYMFSKKNHNV